jgi:hypothetical protein
MRISAFLAPEPIPFGLFTSRPGVLGEFDGGVETEDLVGDAVGEAVRFSLIRRLADGFQVHRLVQAVIRKRLTPGEHEAVSAAPPLFLLVSRRHGRVRRWLGVLIAPVIQFMTAPSVIERRCTRTPLLTCVAV